MSLARIALRDSLLFLVLILAGCLPLSPAAPSPAPTPPVCGPFQVPPDTYLVCALQGDMVLLQTQSGQTVPLSWQNATWTLSGTGLYIPSSETLTETLITLEGTALVSVNGSTRIVPHGAQVILSLDDTGRIHSLSPQPLPYDILSADPVLLSQLPRALALPTAITAPEGDTTAKQDAALAAQSPCTDCTRSSSEACAVRDEWDEARVQAGETLSAIATRYSIATADLQQANCLANPNQLKIGQVLRVPPYPTITPYAQATFTPSVVAFRADSTQLNTGDCTMLRWDVQNISAVFLDEQPTTGSGVLPICPVKTTTYTLRVVYPDGTQTQNPLLVSVVTPTP